MTLVSGWGRFPVVDSEVLRPRSFEAVGAAVADVTGSVARGNGRAYGDAAIGAVRTIGMTGFDRVRSFDPATGRIRLEAGVLLSDLIDTFGPRGFLPFVVPGTRFVSVGGAIAADVHGKNHHGEGGFGRYVDSILLRTGAGETIEISREQNSDAFFATVGGMGLTGVILEATMRLRPVETGWIRERVISASDLDAAMRALEASESSTYSVAWIDCLARGRDLGRSLIYLGEHASADELAEGADRFPVGKNPGLAVPIDLPSMTLNRISIRAFNELYYRMGARRAGGDHVVSLYPYFFPLDSIADWNRIYGRRGFLQHQCVIPEAGARAVLADILDRVSTARRCLIPRSAEEARPWRWPAVVSAARLHAGAGFPGEGRHPEFPRRDRPSRRRRRRTALSRQGCAPVARDVRGRLSRAVALQRDPQIARSRQKHPLQTFTTPVR